MALDWFICGGPIGGSGTTLTIPIDVDVPRTDPALGATIILIYGQSVPGGSTISAITDDAEPEDAYSLCIFEDGLNHYDITSQFSFVNFGLVVNDLVGGVNSITLTVDPGATWYEFVAIAVTGVGPFTAWPSTPFDPSLSSFFGAVAGYEAEQPVGGGGSFSVGNAWSFDSFGGLSIVSPAGAADMDWDWISGTTAFYTLQTANALDIGPYAWADGGITDFFQWDVNTGVSFILQAIGIAAVSPGSAAPSMNGAWSGLGFGQGSGQGFALSPGTGPICDTPPPGGGSPILHGHIRLSE